MICRPPNACGVLHETPAAGVLAHAANLRKAIGTLLDLWMEENFAAMARWLMEQQEHPQQAPE